MANPVGFIFIEEDDLVGLRHGLCAAYMVHVDPAIREHQVRRGNAFLGALVPACARACDIPYCTATVSVVRSGWASKSAMVKRLAIAV